MSQTDGRPLWAVVMAGGSGTRFWPASTRTRPKQLSRIVGERTMLQQTVDRVASWADQVMIITTAALVDETAAQLPDLDPQFVIAEPRGRDTAPCVALAAEVVAAASPDAVMVLLPADHIIEPDDVFAASVQRGVSAAEDGSLVTFGVEPRFPATGYGYLHAVDEVAPGVRLIERFVEKPDAETAAHYLTSSDYYWNSGIFCWRVDAVRTQLAEHCPDIAAAMAPVGSAWGSDGFTEALRTAYDNVTPISIDYALMERADRVVAVIADWSWDDLGSWDAVYDHHEPGDGGTVAVGDTVTVDCTDSLIYQLDGPPIAAVGLEGITVVSTANGILVVPRGEGQRVKELVDELKRQDRTDLL